MQKQTHFLQPEFPLQNKRWQLCSKITIVSCPSWNASLAKQNWGIRQVQKAIIGSSSNMAMEGSLHCNYPSMAMLDEEPMIAFCTCRIPQFCLAKLAFQEGQETIVILLQSCQSCKGNSDGSVFFTAWLVVTVSNQVTLTSRSCLHCRGRDDTNETSLTARGNPDPEASSALSRGLYEASLAADSSMQQGRSI